MILRGTKNGGNDLTHDSRNFLNESPYILLHILIAYVENFLKYHNKNTTIKNFFY